MSKLTITEFLEARIAEDEAVVAHPSPHEMLGGYTYADVGGLSDVLTVGVARVLAECAAKRAIMEQAEEASSSTEYVIQESCINQAEKDEARATDPGRLILHALASVYASHPDYQQEWAL